MPLLLDENLSESVAARITSEFPDAEHVRRVLGAGASDQRVWEYAKARNHLIVTLDQDFERLSVARGAPPKVVLIDARNARSALIAASLIERANLIRRFESDPALAPGEVRGGAGGTAAGPVDRREPEPSPAAGSKQQGVVSDGRVDADRAPPSAPEPVRRMSSGIRPAAGWAWGDAYTRSASPPCLLR